MTPRGIFLDKWCRDVGISRSTAKRWRKILSQGAPMLTIGGNIFGYNFLTAEDDAKFWERARAGEFAKQLAEDFNAGALDPKSPLVESNKVAVSRARARRKGRS